MSYAYRGITDLPDYTQDADVEFLARKLLDGLAGSDTSTVAARLPMFPTKRTLTADGDFALTDASGGLFVVADKATAIAFTLKQDSAMTSAWPADSVIRYINRGVGLGTIVQGTGVTIIGTDLTFATGKGGALVWLSADTWVCLPFSSGSAEYATVSGTTGSPATTTPTVGGLTGTLYDYSANGDFVCSSAGRGLVCVIGGANTDSGSFYGNAGSVFYGWIDFTAATHAVVVGAAASGANDGGHSRIGALAGALGAYKPLSTTEGRGAGRWISGAGIGDGVPVGITGASVTYGKAYPNTNTATEYGSSYPGQVRAGRVFIFIPD